MELLPSDVVCEAHGAPSWIRNPLETGVSCGAHRVRVSWGETFTEIADKLSGYQSLVVVNGRGVSAEALRSAGFSDVRRFAVLPNLAHARLFVPIDGPAAATASAFSLYTPTRWTARLKRSAARLAARSGLPFWYSDEAWLAQREVSPVERVVRRLFPNVPLCLALSSGAPEPARNRKTSLAIVDPRGEILAFAKLARTPLACNLVRGEAEILSSISLPPSTSCAVPRLLFSGPVGERWISVLSPLAGRPAGPRLGSAHRRFLDWLQSGPWKPAATVDQVATLPERLAALPLLRPGLNAALALVKPILESTLVPETIVHGDFAPWNLVECDGNLAAFDWEYGELSGLPLCDELHHRLQVGFLIEGWTTSQGCDALESFANSAPLGLLPDQVSALQSVYLLDILARMFSEGYVDDPIVTWYEDVLARRLKSFREVAVS